MKVRGEYGYFFPMEMSPFLYEDTIAFDFFETVKEPNKMPLQYIPQETRFYKDHEIPFPKLSFPERYYERLRLMDTSFLRKSGVYYTFPERRNVVDEASYLESLS